MKVPAEIKKAINTYFKCESSFEEISEIFQKIESGEITYQDDRFQFSKIRTDIKSLKSLIGKIDVASLEKYADDTTFETIKENLSYYLETIENMDKRVMADEYIENLQGPVRDYFDKMEMNAWEYDKWAKTKNELAGKFISTLARPENIEAYKNAMKRMSLGTMSQREFEKIYHAAKHKMPVRAGFQSFKGHKDSGKRPPEIKYKP